jgi:hypothetical protein
VLRKWIAAMVAMVMMVLMMAAPPAWAIAGGGGQDGQKEPQPTSPLGRDNPNAKLSDNANQTVGTGRGNKFEHGNKPDRDGGCESC